MLWPIFTNHKIYILLNQLTGVRGREAGPEDQAVGQDRQGVRGQEAADVRRDGARGGAGVRLQGDRHQLGGRVGGAHHRLRHQGQEPLRYAHARRTPACMPRARTRSNYAKSLLLLHGQRLS